MTRSRCGYRLWRTRRNAARICCGVSILACLPGIGACSSSVLFGQHHGHNPLGDRRITGIGGMALELEIVVVDLEQHAARVHSRNGTVVLAPSVVLLAGGV